jgi:hypothetical protein
LSRESLCGLLRGSLAGKKVSVEILDPDGQPVKEYGIEFGTKPVFSFYIRSEEAPRIFNSTSNYTFL